MNFVRKLASVLCFATPLLASASDADACGGCFVQQSESTQVTGHRMILSISNDRTSLWDQIVYSGNPASFAWVLPIQGQVDIGLSSDALFQTLEDQTAVSVTSPTISCPPPPSCGNFGGVPGATSTATSSSSSGGGDGVTIIAEEVVGPYETVQLAAEDPAALTAWLVSHGYAIPPDIVPVIDDYVGEGFGFLALKLVPGQGVDSMKPVRVTTPGATPVLPLRMVAAGTGAVTPITLWILGEGRYETTNFPWFVIEETELVWDWDAQKSNYSELRQAGFDSTDGQGWLVEAGEPFSRWQIEDQLEWLAQYDPIASGYADVQGNGAAEALAADLAELFGSIDEAALAVTRLHGELSRAALSTDLLVGAAADQSAVQRWFEAQKTTGTPPPCPEFPPCEPGETPGGGGSWEGFFGPSGSASGPSEGSGDDGGGCGMSGRGSAAGLGALALAAALAMARRRRSER